MKISTVSAGTFYLDGGAMFGIIPKLLWSKKIPADAENRCQWQMRCLIVEEKDRLTLVDTGMGTKQPEKWRSHYSPSEDCLTENLLLLGYTEKDITDVILTHLHFDHAGGATVFNKNAGTIEPRFKNATYWVHSEHFEWSLNPNAKEKGTFLSENILPLEKNKLIKFINKENTFSKNWEFFYSNGHTQKMIVPIINTPSGNYIFAADIIPSHAHVHLPYVMAYDNMPLTTLSEKEYILEKAIKDDCKIIFDHDPFYDFALIAKNEKGYFCKELGIF